MKYLVTEKAPGRERNRPLKDYAGERFGRLVALRLVSRDLKWNGHKWLFVCDCGKEKIISIKSVRTGNTQSCGCLSSERLAERNKTHGLSKSNSLEYRSWKDMRMRCRNHNDTDWDNYGGRGIAICERWEDFSAFLADMGPRPRGYTLDRIDSNGNYEPSNCRWATAKTQANNKRSNVYIVIGGEKRTAQEWSDHYGLNRETVLWRLKQGWPMKRVFTPQDQRRALSTFPPRGSSSPS